MSDLVLIQPENQPWWSGDEVPFRVVELNGKREVMVNVTRMLAGVGKTWSRYQRLEGSQELIAHAEHALQICRAELIQTETAPGPSQGTWAIKTIALDAAAWASTPLRWWMLETALAKIESRDIAPTPGSPWSLQTVAALGRSMVLLAEGQQAQQLQLDTLTTDVADIKQEIRKTDLMRACEKFDVPHPSTWQIPSLTGREINKEAGLYWIGDPFGDPEKPHYIGESGNLNHRLYRKRHEHAAIRFLGATGRCYETKILYGYGNVQFRRNIEDALTTGSQPHWKFNPAYMAGSKDLQQFKSMAYPIHNYQMRMIA
tara:strand:- start:197 stop:1141 length:945 start_codon:yes stop_codon:yes gene_type:complete